MQSMDKDGATVVDMVAEWLEDNGVDGLTDGRCFCTGGASCTADWFAAAGALRRTCSPARGAPT